MMRTEVAMVGVVVALATVVAGCGAGDEEAAGGTAPVKVGGIFDLTGPTADVGKPYADGVRDYVEQINGDGGIEGRKIELVADDYAYEVPQAEQLYSRLKSEGVVGIQGWGTADTEALSSRINQDELPYLSASYTADVADPAKTPFNFVPGMTYSDEIRALLDYIAGASGGQHAEVAVFHSDSPFGQSPLEAGKQHIEQEGLDIGYQTYAMAAEATNYAAELSKAKRQGADWILIQHVPTPSAQLAKDARSQGVDAQLVCLVYCSSEAYAKLAGPAGEGTIGIFPFVPVTADVPGLDRVAEAIGSREALEQTNVHYIQGYYSMHAMAEGIRRVLESGEELTGDSLRLALEELEPLDTGDVTASFDWTVTSHASILAAPLYQLKGDQWEQIQEATAPAGG